MAIEQVIGFGEQVVHLVVHVEGVIVVVCTAEETRLNWIRLVWLIVPRVIGYAVVARGWVKGSQRGLLLNRAARREL